MDMTYSLRQQIAECYRCADEYSAYASNLRLGRASQIFLATMQLTRLGDHLRRQLQGNDRDEFEGQILRR
jgi:hypothetical protein